MATTRKLVFTNDYYYHVFNRGIDRKETFSETRECIRALELLYYYQFNHLPLRYSVYKDLPLQARNEYLNRVKKSGTMVDVIAYCLMPNHFHLLLKQKRENGVRTFISNFTNAYIRYFNTKHKRLGPLFEGVFKAVFVETDEQLLHLSRYIHLNPVVASLVEINAIDSYAWSSYNTYTNGKQDYLTAPEIILEAFSSVSAYKLFISDQVNYAKRINLIKHLTFD